MNQMNVLYSTDSNYAPHAAASICSLLDHNRDFDCVNIFVLEDDLSQSCKEKLTATVSSFENGRISFYPLKTLLEKMKLCDKSGYAPAGYGRLMISNVLGVDKILYLDCDTIVNGSLKDLWEIDLGDDYVAGVQDNPAAYCLTAIAMDQSDRYINGGVLLMNLKEWREDDLEQQFLDLIQKHNGYVHHHDQGIINGVCKGRIRILHPRFNTMSQFYLLNADQIKKLYDITNYYSEQELSEAREAPVVIHYITKFYNRPWFKSCTHPHKDKYVQYLSKTPFEVKLLEGELSRKVRLRRFVFMHAPFWVYYALERLLDIRRKKIILATK